MNSLLKNILENTSERVKGRKKQLPLSRLEQLIEEQNTGGAQHRFLHALEKPGIQVIAEYKRSSPTTGPFPNNLELETIISEYEKGGAAALSILTEEDYFLGSLNDLKRAKENSSLPLLQKDFILDPYQIYEAKLAGAAAILLIAAALSKQELESLNKVAHDLHLDVLVEIHTREELEIVLSLEPALIGINNRDLNTFQVNLKTTENLCQLTPKEITIVSESGIKTSTEVSRLEELGVKGVLVGSVLMQSLTPNETIKKLLSP